MTTPALSNNIFMHCTETYLQVKEYKNVLDYIPEKLRMKQIFKADVPLYIRLKATTILTITSSLST